MLVNIDLLVPGTVWLHMMSTHDITCSYVAGAISGTRRGSYEMICHINDISAVNGLVGMLVFVYILKKAVDPNSSWIHVRSRPSERDLAKDSLEEFRSRRIKTWMHALPLRLPRWMRNISQRLHLRCL